MRMKQIEINVPEVLVPYTNVEGGQSGFAKKCHAVISIYKK